MECIVNITDGKQNHIAWINKEQQILFTETLCTQKPGIMIWNLTDKEDYKDWLYNSKIFKNRVDDPLYINCELELLLK